MKNPNPKSVPATVNPSQSVELLQSVKDKYGVKHVFVRHHRKPDAPVYKLTAVSNLYIRQPGYKQKGGRTVVSLTVDGTRHEATAVCGNDTSFNKRIGYSQALYNLLSK